MCTYTCMCDIVQELLLAILALCVGYSCVKHMLSMCQLLATKVLYGQSLMNNAPVPTLVITFNTDHAEGAICGCND